MKMRYTYVYFYLQAQTSKTKVWRCRNNKNQNLLGTVKWFSRWRQYCFFPETNTIFSIGCMKDIMYFIEQVKEDYNVNKEKR